jgi:hypothetical protein
MWLESWSEPVYSPHSGDEKRWSSPECAFWLSDFKDFPTAVVAAIAAPSAAVTPNDEDGKINKGLDECRREVVGVRATTRRPSVRRVSRAYRLGLLLAWLDFALRVASYGHPADSLEAGGDAVVQHVLVLL